MGSGVVVVETQQWKMNPQHYNLPTPAPPQGGVQAYEADRARARSSGSEAARHLGLAAPPCLLSLPLGP